MQLHVSGRKKGVKNKEGKKERKKKSKKKKRMGLGQILGSTNMPIFRRVHKWSKCINQPNEVSSAKVQERSPNLSQ